MRRHPVGSASLLGALLLLSPAPSFADRFWALQLKGGSVVLAMDRPVERGEAIVFHRHPDALFASLRARDVVRITSAEGPAKKTPKSLDGQILVFGRDADPPDALPPPPPEPPDASADAYAYPAPYPYGASTGYVPHGHRARRPPPTTIGPNGFPLLSPAFGGSSPQIGPNGFPILSTTPVPATRRPG